MKIYLEEKRHIKIHYKKNMELHQVKLTKAEWIATEVPVSAKEHATLKMIIKNFHTVNARENPSLSLASFLKVVSTPEMEVYLFHKYFAASVNRIHNLYKLFEYVEVPMSRNTIKKADVIRIQNYAESKFTSNTVFEWLVLEVIENVVKLQKLKKLKNTGEGEWVRPYFTLYKLMKTQVVLVNPHVRNYANAILDALDEEIDMISIIKNASELIERNEVLLKNDDVMLYEHQKQIFTAVHSESPQLILYICPTGTGKTITPIGLSEKYRVIFVCAARHVGLALARAAVSVHKKVAFAFGCSSADDIRLHYFAAKDYTIHKRSGRIGKVDNSVGDKVEIMICDIRSYLCAMFYMMAFNDVKNIFTFWDEPTITMDYVSHPLHETIQKNWRENLIPHMALSSATLPKMHELTETLADFKERFPGAVVTNIQSFDCKKSIPIVSRSGYIVLPHYLSPEYSTIIDSVAHCEENLTLMRYFDLGEVANFIHHIETTGLLTSQRLSVKRAFPSLHDVNMLTIKLHYLLILKSLDSAKWPEIYDYFMKTRTAYIKPSSNGQIKTVSTNFGIYVSTKDAYTLTDGPTIFLAQDVIKIAKFCVQEANIPSHIMATLTSKIEYNNTLGEKLDALERRLEDLAANSEAKTEKTDKSASKKKDREDNEDKSEISRLRAELDSIHSLIKPIQLNELFVPNKHLHLKLWAEGADTSRVFTSDIDEISLRQIMALKKVEDTWKILLLLGIGVFTSQNTIEYTEIMKSLADNQKLFMIIADSDYIYGTNYQFCHGYLGKDITLTQEKTLQACGRVGRGNIQQQYSIRLRDDSQITKIFFAERDKIEVVNMRALLVT